MTFGNPTRRDFLQTVGLVTGGTLLGCTLNEKGSYGSETTVVRGNVMTTGAGALDSYRKAVAAMRALPSSDPRSWEAQARIHLDHCPHGNAFFLPWHRAYLQYFEQVCRAMSGDPGFALPYWNWSTQATVPPPFWEGTLNDSTRVIGPSDPMPSWAVGQPVIDDILAISDFETFGSSFVPSTCTTNCQRQPAGTGSLEGTPHNVVHGTIGGNMGTYMSPLDPIFWLHHCNVDRLWVEWNKSFANPNNTYWRTFTFESNFVDGQGNDVPSVEVQSVFNTVDLGYRYDTQPASLTAVAAPAATTARVVAAVEVENTATAARGAALTIPVRLTPEVRERLAPGATLAGTDTTVRLSLGGIATPAEPVRVNVYVGGAGAPTSTDSPSFVRSFTFFPTVAADEPHNHEKTFLFDVGDKLAGAGDSVPVHVETAPLRARAEAAVAAPSVTPTSVKIEVIEHS